jgi:ArsR family transcriptional regulator, virulence genes transcriptional regulator
MSTFQELEKNASQAANLLKVMSNENRLMILCTLLEHPLSVSELNQQIPLSQSALSQHLHTLRKAQLVKTEKNGVSVIYSVNGDQSIQILHTLKNIFCTTDNK